MVGGTDRGDTDMPLTNIAITNAKPAPRAFSSEVDTGSREENAIKQKLGAIPRFGELRNCSRITKLSDGEGLQLWIMPNGSKLWRLAYRYAGKQKLVALGAYPAVTPGGSSNSSSPTGDTATSPRETTYNPASSEAFTAYETRDPRSDHYRKRMPSAST